MCQSVKTVVYTEMEISQIKRMGLQKQGYISVFQCLPLPVIQEEIHLSRQKGASQQEREETLQHTDFCLVDLLL